MSGGISATTIALGAAAVAGGAVLAKSMSKQSTPAAPAAQNVEADANQAAADASSTAMQQRTAKRRAYRAQSLLASGSGGDTSNVITGTPTATGKQTLGA